MPSKCCLLLVINVTIIGCSAVLRSGSAIVFTIIIVTQILSFSVGKGSRPFFCALLNSVLFLHNILFVNVVVKYIYITFKWMI